jgi:predicted DNA-binding transcriptional regulator AlpA
VFALAQVHAEAPPVGFGQKPPISDSTGMTTPELIRAPLAAQRYAMSRRTLTRRMCDDPDFPQPIRMSKRLLLFKLAELDAYFERKRAAQEGGKCLNEGGQG